MPIMRATTYANAVHVASEGNSPDGEALAQLFRHTQVDRTDAPHCTDLWKGLTPTDYNLDSVRLLFPFSRPCWKLMGARAATA